VERQRGNLHAAERMRRALCADVEQPDRSHIVPEELDAHGIGVGVREYVHDPAAAGEVAGHLDRLTALEAVLREPAGEHVRVERVAGIHAERLGGDGVG